ELLRLELHGEAGHPAQQTTAVEQAVEGPGSVAEQGELLLQVDVDAAEEDALLADVRLVGADGGVRRDQQDVVALADEFRSKSVVVHAAAAVHARGTGGDITDLSCCAAPRPPAPFTP